MEEEIKGVNKIKDSLAQQIENMKDLIKEVRSEMEEDKKKFQIELQVKAREVQRIQTEYQEKEVMKIKFNPVII